MGVYGKGTDCYFMEPTVTSGTTAVVGHPLNAMQDYDIVGVQLIMDPITANVDIGATDAVVASSKTWTFLGFDFTGLAGSTLHVTGAAHAGNNGDWVISSVTSAHIVVTTTASGLANETFDPNTVNVTVINPQTMDGAWTVEVSNDVTPDGNGGSYDQPNNVEGHWTDITDLFQNPAIAPVDHTDAATQSQYVQATICVRSMRFTFTPTTGDGAPSVIGQARSYS